MKIAISPCPNDTFSFHGWIEGKVGRDLPVEATFADIQQLNAWAFEKRFPLIKLSIGCYAQVQEAYELLPVGAALGFGCGPKLVARNPFPLSDLTNKTIAIPGRDTTAHLLLNRLLPPPQKKVFCLYHEIPSLIARGEVDGGLIIHETRFTFAQAGLVEIVDLGTLWHAQTALPLPLGGVCLLRTAPPPIKARITAILRESLAHAQRYPDQAQPFILQHSQEKDPAIVRQHIATYVNEETAQLSEEGRKAINYLIR